MTLPRVACASLLAALLLGGCAAVPEPPAAVTRTVSSAPGTVKARLVERLVELGFTVAGTAAIEAGHAAPDPAWARCGTILVRDASTGFSRADRAEPGARRATVDAKTVAGGSSTLVTLTTRHVATYRDIYRNMPFTGGCVSTGRLEADLLAAAG